MPQLVDCHVHLNNYTKDPADIGKNLDGLRIRMKRYGIDHAIVLTSYVVNENRPRVEEVLDLVAPYPDISVVEGILFQEGKPVGLEGTRERLAAKRIVGLKMYPGYLPFYPNAPECRPVYELAAEFGVPVMFHAGDTYAKGARVKFSHPIHIDDVAVDHPDLKIILCHLGNPWFRDAAEILYKNDNVYADISGLVLEGFEANLERYLAEEVREVVRYMGEPDRLLYGTDWPLVRMRPYIGFLESLGFSERSLERVRWRNAQKLFGIKVKRREDKA